MKGNHPVLPYLLLALAACTWGGNIVLGRAMHGDIPPLALTFFRWAVAFVFVVPVCLGKFRQEIGIVKSNLKWLFLVSATGVAIFHSFIYTGLNSTTAINAGLMMAVSPILIPGI
ncbi:MAG: DMT family transporter, partial [Rhodospirillales bacterium]|nr:DMT family transporter [Rhodospirillales bacterium]